MHAFLYNLYMSVQGRTALMLACRAGKEELVKALLKCKAKTAIRCPRVRLLSCCCMSMATLSSSLEHAPPEYLFKMISGAERLQ